MDWVDGKRKKSMNKSSKTYDNINQFKYLAYFKSNKSNK